MALIEKGESHGHDRRHLELPPVLEENLNYSGHTIKNYMHTLKQFVVWVDVPIEEVSHKKLLAYLDHLLDRGLKPKTINYYPDSTRGFYCFPVAYPRHDLNGSNHWMYMLVLLPDQGVS